MQVTYVVALILCISALINSIYVGCFYCRVCRKLEDELSKAQTEIANLWHQIEYPDDK